MRGFPPELLPSQKWEGHSIFNNCQYCLYKLTQSSQFEALFSTLIVLNSLCIGAEVEFVAQNPGAPTPVVFFMLQSACSGAFCVELFLRILAEPHFFFNPVKNISFSWNMFDAFLVLSSLVEAGFDIAGHATGSTTVNSQNLSNLRLVRIVRIGRLIRLLRVARMVKYVRSLSILIHSIASTLRALIWALLLLVFIMYFFAIVFTQAVSEHLLIKSDGSTLCGNRVTDQELVICEELVEFWGSLVRSSFTLFASITGGIEWEKVYSLLGEVSEIWLVTFLVFISFSYLAVLNVITGVFCQRAIDTASQDRELKIQDVLQHKEKYTDAVRKQVSMMFQALGCHDGRVPSFEDVQMNLHLPAVQAYFTLLELDVDDAGMLFALLEADSKPNLEFDDFVQGCLKLKGSARSIDMAILMEDLRRLGHRMTTLEHTVVPSEVIAATASSAGGCSLVQARCPDGSSPKASGTGEALVCHCKLQDFPRGAGETTLFSDFTTPSETHCRPTDIMVPRKTPELSLWVLGADTEDEDAHTSGLSQGPPSPICINSRSPRGAPTRIPTTKDSPDPPVPMPFDRMKKKSPCAGPLLAAAADAIDAADAVGSVAHSERGKDKPPTDLSGISAAVGSYSPLLPVAVSTQQPQPPRRVSNFRAPQHESTVSAVGPLPAKLTETMPYETRMSELLTTIEAADPKAPGLDAIPHAPSKVPPDYVADFSVAADFLDTQVAATSSKLDERHRMSSLAPEPASLLHELPPPEPAFL